MVFTPPDGLLNLVDFSQWWRYVPGADWRHPLGPGSSVEGKQNHPVVDIAYEDAQAYARWLGGELPTEAQWEFAARGGLDGATYSWGEEYYDPVDGWRANSWQGFFPLNDDADDGYHGTAPVGCFAPNGYGLFDMAGNVWEYARDWYVPGHPDEPAGRARDRDLPAEDQLDPGCRYPVVLRQHEPRLNPRAPEGAAPGLHRAQNRRAPRPGRQAHGRRRLVEFARAWCARRLSTARPGPSLFPKGE